MAKEKPPISLANFIDSHGEISEADARQALENRLAGNGPSRNDLRELFIQVNWLSVQLPKQAIDSPYFVRLLTINDTLGAYCQTIYGMTADELLATQF